MRFEEKLINLRKQKSMSQEELAEHLKVTRQTISKWELGQSKPDMDKLMEISKLFNVSIEMLMDENANIEKEKVVAKSNKKERKWILYVLIVILIASLATLVVRIGTAREQEKQKQEGLLNNIFGTVTGMIEDQMGNNNTSTNHNANDIMSGIKDTFDSINQQVTEEVEETKENPEMFNSGLTYAEGTNATIFVENILDTIVTKNKLNKDRQITVVYKNKKTTDIDEIKTIKKSLKEWSEYEVSVDYDDKGYITKVTIEE